MSESHEVRELRFRIEQGDLALKALQKQNGLRDQKIYRLRCELALVRQVNDKIARGELRRLERQLDEAGETIELLGYQVHGLQEKLKLAGQMADNAELREKLAAAETSEDKCLG